MKQVWSQVRKYRFYTLGVLLASAALYSFVTRDTSPSSPTTTSQTPTVNTTAAATTAASPAASTTSTPAANAATANAIIDASMQFASLDTANQKIYYLHTQTSELRSYNLSTKQTQGLGELNPYVIDLRWSPNHESLLLILENTRGNRVNNPLYQSDVDFGELVVGHYTISQRQFTALNAKISTADFLTDDRILYHYNDTGNKNISTAKTDGSDWKEIITFASEAMVLRSGSTVLVANESGNVTRYDNNNKKIESFTLPDNTTLTGGAFIGAGRNGIVGRVANNNLTVFRLKPGADEVLVTLAAPEGDFQLLWDNKTNDIYLAGYSGLIKIATSQP